MLDHKNKLGGSRVKEENHSAMTIITNVLLFVFVAAALMVGGIWIYTTLNRSERLDPLKNDIAQYEKNIMYYQNQEERYTPKKINEKIEKDEINVREKLNQKEKDITEGVTVVYEQTKNEDDYNNLSDKIKPKLGDSFSEQLIALDKPSLGQTGEKQLAYDKLDDVKIAFGEYDFSNHTAECYVLVDYQTPTITATNTGMESEEKKNILKGQDFFSLNYSLDEDELELVNHQQAMKDEVEEVE